MPHVLVTGASGFFGGVVKRRLLREGYSCVNLDMLPDTDQNPKLTSVQGDIRDEKLLEQLFKQHGFDGVIHCAAMLAHGKIDPQELWTSNVDGTRNIAAACLNAGVRKMVFISSNCLWA